MTRTSLLAALGTALALSAGGLLASTAFAKTPPPVAINEFVSHPSSGGSEWVELYNTTNHSIDLSGWQIKDLTFPASSHTPDGTTTAADLSQTIAAHHFLAVDVSGLNNDGDVITLLDNSGTSIDQVAYGTVTGYTADVTAPQSGESAYRTTNGGDTWSLTNTPTRGYTNTPIVDTTVHPRAYFLTIQAAVDAAQPGDTIEVTAGTTTEAVTIDKALTLVGTKHAGLIGQITVDANNVTIKGMAITNPSGVNGVLVNDVNNVTIEYNVFYGIGTSFAGSSATQAVNIQKTSSHIVVDRNTFTNLGETANTSSNKAIYVGDSDGGTSSDVSITRNAVNGVVANHSPSGSGGHGAYGILVNHEVDNLVVTGNRISNLDGLWAHAVGLEANTPGAVVEHNTVHNLTDYKTPSDSVAFRFESNPGALTTTMASDSYGGHLASNASTTVAVDSSWATLSSASNTYPEVLYGNRYYYYGINAFATIQEGLDAVAPGGRVLVAGGAYTTDLTFTKDGVSLVGSGKKYVQITSDGKGLYGVFLDKAKNVTLKYFTFTVSPSDAHMNYALHADQADGLSLTNVTFNGVAKNTSGGKIGGIDLNTTSNVTLNGVTANGFGKNGFSFLSIYSNGETAANDVTFNNTAAEHNGWAGYAFYTVGADRSTNTPPSTGPGASITGVQFTGTNYAYFNGAEGVQVEGDSDANVGAHATPAYTVTTDGKKLDLSHVNFKGNGFDIVNYQTAQANAIGSKFNGRTGDAMTAAQIATEDSLIYDHLDLSSLGLVRYHAPAAPTNLHFTHWGTSLACGSIATTTYPGNNYGSTLNLVWDDSQGTHRTLITYPNGATTTAWTGSHNLWIGKTPYTDYGFGSQSGTYTYQVQAQDAGGAWSDYSAPCTLGYDTHAPSVTFTTPPTPAEGAAVNNDFPVQFTAHDDVALKSVDVSLYDMSNPSHPWQGESTCFSTSTLTGPDFSDTCTLHLPASLPDGRYFLKGDAQDQVGRWALPKATRNIIVDRTKPDFTLDTPAQGATVPGSFTIGGTATDTLSGIDRVTYSVTQINAIGGTWVSSIASSTATYDGVSTWQGSVSGLANGYYRINAQAYDKAGNMRWASHYHDVTVVNAGPSLSITAPAADGDYATSTYAFTASYTHGVTTTLDWAPRSRVTSITITIRVPSQG